MRKLLEINKLLKDKDFCTKVKIYLATKSYGEDYDEYEDNYNLSNLNPITIKGYVTEVSPSALVWKGYGLKEIGAKEIICEARYENYFKKAAKIEIDGEEYEVFREAVGNRSIIQKRPYQLIRILLQKKT